ncbi:MULTISPECIES: N-acetylglucosamine-specific PTS transporter subunit IIBC [Clostridium]|uniref:PTS transporter subunit EIIC n=1 Tax=Clostridium paridis TaxID=2803863 RepID=A0A937FGY2_9CLOT|nr:MULTISPECIES: N-acetylglucosamine-specific PTS transporter subunit IIBC [Clostridium]MBL4933564.1 PTS transporter subunit EIIC [Clostridium paridis]MDD7796354.1 N-acetylglucosamine-specific PTS transporter subunit IIBC [Clostridium sp. 'White wine YQ']
MSKGNNRVLAYLQRIGKSLMTPVAVMPAAALMLRLGQNDVWAWTGNQYLMEKGIPWMAAAGNAVFGHLALLFAIGIAVGLAEENNGVAALSSAVGYFVITEVAATFNKDINMGVLAGIIVGIVAGELYNKYKDIKVPQFLGFFGGKRFVPIVTSLVCLILGVLAGYGWIRIQWGLDTFGNAVANSGSVGTFGFGLLNRLLIPFGLHHVMNSIFWFQFGTFTNAAGEIVRGDLTRYFAGDPNSGQFMTGFFPIMMFGLPAACLAMITAAKKERRKEVTGMLLGLAFTSFLTGITEPIEFSFMFIAPVLYGIHAVLTGVAGAVTYALNMKIGFGFSAGFIDYALNFNKPNTSNPLGLALVGLVFAAIYYFVFLFFIKKFDIKTPGREDEDAEDVEVRSSSKGSSDLAVKAQGILDAIGGKGNVETIDACVTRIRLSVADGSKINEKELKKLGASGIMKMGEGNYQIVVGTLADPIVSHMKKLMK